MEVQIYFPALVVADLSACCLRSVRKVRREIADYAQHVRR